MKAILFGILFLVNIVPAGLFAAEVLLPELVGEYPDGEYIPVAVDFGRPIADLSQVGLELIGIVEPSWYAVDSDTFSWGGQFLATFMEPDPGFWMTADDWSSLGTENYSLTYFHSLFGGTSDFLSDGRGEMSFAFRQNSLAAIYTAVGPSPSGTIISARLVFEDVVDVEMDSWGGVKSLFK